MMKNWGDLVVLAVFAVALLIWFVPRPRSWRRPPTAWELHAKSEQHRIKIEELSRAVDGLSRLIGPPRVVWRNADGTPVASDVGPEVVQSTGDDEVR